MDFTDIAKKKKMKTQTNSFCGVFFKTFFYLQIADELRPSPFVISALTKLCKFIPTWKIIPTNDIIDVAFKVPEIREQVKYLPYLVWCMYIYDDQLN